MGVRYALSEIAAHWSDREWWRKRFLTHVVSKYFETVGGPDATPLVERNWDNLVLLDACRYDLFAEVLADSYLPGELEKRQSVASGTPGYVAKNFSGDRFHDVVYVTANPYVNTDLPQDTFHAVDPVWQDGWDDETQTVLPETMGERALAAAAEYPDKRLLIHFNQPHAPFVGEDRLGGRKVSAIRKQALGEARPDPGERRPTPFEQLARGKYSREEVWQAYRSNLERAFPVVEDLLGEFEGLTAVTADHGNALGEFARPFPIRVYGHPLGVLIPALTAVPWHRVLNGERKEVTSEPPVRVDAHESEDVADRLRMLGYAE